MVQHNISTLNVQIYPPSIKTHLKQLMWSVFRSRELQKVLCVSVVHLTDLHYVLICWATLGCVRNISDRAVCSNGHHLHWDGYRLSGQHCCVQNLIVLETKRGQKDRSVKEKLKTGCVSDLHHNRSETASSERMETMQPTESIENYLKLLCTITTQLMIFG